MFKEYNEYLLYGVKKTKRLTFNELFSYWREQLIMRIMAIFEYKNLNFRHILVQSKIGSFRGQIKAL